ncbi:MAG: serine/threonine protein kinase [Cellulomonas iranensis]|uniref:serine/threonine-protein kinase n=1 Tax=Cellulomonas iranensis TaxID=76862 RepID=UPI001B00E93A|nr:serine/threonine-protein kinase [Cellulomonas iranensis]MBO9568048.1 serine/threonine protein kinase [Cellulomonas iranensis]UCN14728.1 serine/threonine protein kinase [Cellulomonas iranensis]
MRTAPGVALGGGRYRLLRRIAVGGMGEVWEANDDALARAVAVKVLRAEFAGDAGFLERFRTEARNSASLHHPHIAALFDYGEQDGSAYLVMELVVGEPLSDLLEREPVLAPQRLLPVLAQTARGLHAAHLAGVVHRDVKPGNILLARSGKVKITDFGVSLASNQKTMTATGMVMGTAQYLSPEQAVGRPATPLSDLYSLGVVAYEALAGKRPFTGPTAVDIAVAHVNDPVPPLPAAVDRKLAALVLRLLSKEPSERPASGEELAALLDQLVPRTPPSGVAVLVSKPTRARDEHRTSARSSSAAPERTHPGGASSAPPSYAPSRRDRGARAAAPDDRRRRSRHEAPAARPLDGVLAWVRRLRLPLVVLVLVLVALLGAALADRLLGAAPAEPAWSTTTDQYPRGGGPGGMIAAVQQGGGAAGPADGTRAAAHDPRSTEVKDA